MCRGSSSDQISSSGNSSHSCSSTRSPLATVASDWSLRILHAISTSLPATIMSKVFILTFSEYSLTNSLRSIPQGSMSCSRTRLNAARMDSSTGSVILSPSLSSSISM